VKPEKVLRDALLRRRLKEVVELAKADPVYGVSPEEAIRRAAAKVAQKHGPAGVQKKGGVR
jgi:hypothetical protein